MDLEHITAARAAFVAEIREWSESQQETWRRVPWLALQAAGRDGGLHDYGLPYNNGLWELLIPNWHYARAYVDCDTGNIVSIDYQKRSTVRADDNLVLRLGNYLELLDAGRVCSNLQAQAAQPTPSWISDDEAVDRSLRRTAIAKRLGLSEIYHRHKPAIAA